MQQALRKYRLLAVLTLVSSIAGPLSASSLDRDYRFGDNGTTDAVLRPPDVDQAAIVSEGNPAGFVFAGIRFTGDDVGPSGAFQDLRVRGDVSYTRVNNRPGGGTGFGLAFDGNGDYLFGANLNHPDTSAASVNNDDDPSDPQRPGPLNYAGIVERSFQAWVKPTGDAQNETQSVIMDSNQHGIRIVDGMWSIRYSGIDVTTSEPVNFDNWSHVQLATMFAGGTGAKLFVDGVLVGGVGGNYDIAAHEELVVGSNTARDGNGNFTGGQSEFFSGVLDDLSFAIIGDNTTAGGQDFGAFDFVNDNDFAALRLGGLDIADVNGDGQVAGNGTGLASEDDVSAFVSGWLMANEVNGFQLGDLNSRLRGDLNLDGNTNLADWAILNAANPAAGQAAAAALASVPEPAGATVACWAVMILACGWRRSGGSRS